MTGQVTELGLADYVHAVRRRWRWLLGVLVICVGLVSAFVFTKEPVYQSDADVLILTEGSTGLFPLEQTVELQLLRNPLSELQLATSQQYKRAVFEKLGGGSDVEISLVTTPGAGDIENSSVIRFDATGSTAQKAGTAAQTYAETYIELRNQDDIRAAQNGLSVTTDLLADLTDQLATVQAPIVERRNERIGTEDPIRLDQLNREIADLEADSQSTINALTTQINDVGRQVIDFEQAVASLESRDAASRVLNAAQLPSEPISPDIPLSLGASVLVGLVLGLLLAGFRELLDTGAQNPTELAELADAPVIASIPQLSKQRSARGGVMPFDQLPPVQAGAYRVLLNSLWFNSNGSRPRSVAVTSVREGIGSSQTAVNLAQAEARRGVDVLLIDADFANPTVLERLGLLDEGAGLADLLSSRCGVEDAIRATGIDNLHVIGTGSVDKTTPDRLRSNRLQSLIGEIEPRYELIVVDTPPTTGVVDSRAVASQCDGVVVVYDPNSSKRRDVADATDTLRSAKAHVVGLVSNRTRLRRSDRSRKARRE